MVKEAAVYAEADAKNLPWGKLGVDVVLECTGFYTSKPLFLGGFHIVLKVHVACLFISTHAWSCALAVL